MTYVVSKDTETRNYEGEMPYEAVRQFMKELGLTSREGISVRSYGGKNVTAESVWPRAR